MEVSVMRHLPTPFSAYDPRPSYTPWDNRPHHDAPTHSKYDFTFRYPPSPPMERQSHTSLPPISTLLANIRESQSEHERSKREASRLESARIDPRLNGPPTPPSRSQQYPEAPRSAPLRQQTALQLPKQSTAYPPPHDSRQSSASSYASRPSMHRHRLSSSSSWSTSSARAPSPQSAPPVEHRGSLYPPTMHRPSAPEYSPRTPQSPPTISTPASHSSDYDRHWSAVPQGPHHQQYAPVSQATYAPHGPPGTQTLHLSPVSSQPQTTHPDRYVCPQCAKAFSRPSSLRIHVHSHTGEKPFVCPHAGCGKAFSVRSNMKRHQRGCHVDGASGRDVDEMDMEDA